ncbi:MAG: hypothetical protein J6I49_07045 [Bacteroidales bacterium]|nr:hypothetical protein [Bacteroidales bacterium]
MRPTAVTAMRSQQPFLLACVLLLSVAFVPTLRAQEADTSATKNLVFAKETPDSVLKQKVFLFPYSPFAVKINRIDHPNLSPSAIQHHDLLDAHNGTYYLSTGVLGHPHYSIFPLPQVRLTHCLQPDEMRAYAADEDNITLHQSQTPYSLLAYQSSLDKDYQLDLAHAQNILPGWNASFRYHLTNPEGVFVNSAARNHRIEATTNYFSPDSRLQVAAVYLWQSFNVNENGGMTDDTYFTSGRQSNFAGLPMQYATAGVEHTSRSFMAKTTYNFVRQTDTADLPAPRLFNVGVLGVEGGYRWRKRAAYLPSATDSTQWSDLHASLFWTNDAYPDHRWRNPLKITLGITPRRLHAAIPTDTLSAASLLNPFATAVLALGRMSATLEVQADNTLRQSHPTLAQTEWMARAILEVPFDSAGRHTLLLRAARQHAMPDLRALMDGGGRLRQMQVSHLEAHFRRQADGGPVPLLEVQLRASQLDGWTWYDTLLAPCQGYKAFWHLQATLTAQLRAGIMRLDMQQMVQHSTDASQLPLPLWATKNSLYADFTLFRRALHLQIGVDVRYHTPFHADTYDPASGLFLRQEEAEVGGYLWGDVFVNLQVKRASIYLKAGHVNALWEVQPAYMLLPHYPGQKFGLYWGMAWHFFD